MRGVLHEVPLGTGAVWLPWHLLGICWAEAGPSVALAGCSGDITLAGYPVVRSPWQDALW